MKMIINKGTDADALILVTGQKDTDPVVGALLCTPGTVGG